MPHVPRDIMDLIIPLLGPAELARSAKATRYLRQRIQDRQHALFDLRKLLQPFFPNINDFRILQARTGLLVSGSQALQFLGRLHLGAKDIDIYVGTDTAYVVIDWLVYTGYKLVFRSSTAPDDNRLLSVSYLHDKFGFPLHASTAATYFLRPGQILFKFEKDDLCIDLIVTGNTPFAAVCDFHSSMSGI